MPMMFGELLAIPTGSCNTEAADAHDARCAVPATLAAPPGHSSNRAKMLRMLNSKP